MSSTTITHESRTTNQGASAFEERFQLRKVDPQADAHILHAWFTQPRGHFWGMGQASLEEVRQEMQGIDDAADHEAFLGLDALTGLPLFLAELYDPATAAVAEAYDVVPGDVGMHLFIGPRQGEAESGFSLAVMRRILREAFEVRGARRVVVEPDVKNVAVQVLNGRAGFRAYRQVSLDEGPGKPRKEALLSFCTEQDYLECLEAGEDQGEKEQNATGKTPAPGSYLNPEHFGAAERRLCAKILGEFAHERLIFFEEISPGDAERVGRYSIELDDGTQWGFQAQRYILDHWFVDPESISCPQGQQPSAVALILGLRSRLPLSDDLLPVYLEEIQATLASLAFKNANPGPSSNMLAAPAKDTTLHAVAQAFQAIESSMTEGHPCFVANSGRHGMGADELARYSPEAGVNVALQWLGVRRDLSHFSSVHGLDHEELLSLQFPEQDREGFERIIRDRGFCPEDYFIMPAHPWQVEHKIIQSFSSEVAAGQIILLGEGSDCFRAQQSLRTFFNVSSPERYYAKTALSVINMGFMRGLSAAYMKDTPAINEWLQTVFAEDEQLRATGVGLIREVAAVGYTSPVYTQATEASSPYRKMMAGLWRESPLMQIEPGEELSTMAALLHRDAQGVSMVSALIQRSGLDASQWLRAYMKAYLIPVVHCLGTYRLAFMPHGENVILVLKDGVVQRVIMKDIGEEISVIVSGGKDAVLAGKIPGKGPMPPLLPEGVDRIYSNAPDDDVAMSVFTDVFDCFFRFLAPILHQDGMLDEMHFWPLIRSVLEEYFEQHPEASWLGLFDEEFQLSCLNRLQLRNTQHMLDLGDQNAGLQRAGVLSNPVSEPI